MQGSLIHESCDYLQQFESVNPLGAHTQFIDDWKEEARSLVPVDSKELEFALSVRSAFHFAASDGGQASEDLTDWSWLLTTDQIAQRTPEWFAEGKRVLTASEIAAIWKGPGTRAALVVSKTQEPELMVSPPRLAVRRADTKAMDWGVRYEPVVKKVLEDTLKCRIQELGRIRHRTIANLAASPDGLIVECEAASELVGCLVEIKCPPTRVIKEDAIPFEYWCQMQLQMEVCDRPFCEFVEAKFKERGVEEPKPTTEEVQASGWISLLCHQDTMQMKYKYCYTETELEEEVETPWVVTETYMWDLVKLRRVRVLRDQSWFEKIQPDLTAFWQDVEGARAGTWQRPPVRARKMKKSGVGDQSLAANPETCAIVDSDGEGTAGPPVEPVEVASGGEAICVEEPTSYTNSKTV
jgi:putative phage-type endonuclease